MGKLIPNLNTLADVIDRLAVEVNKLSFMENMKREEQGKENPDKIKISYWDNLSRDCCEYRSMLKNEINRILSEIVKNGTYETLSEVRTFRPPKKSVADLISDRCYKLGNKAFTGKLAKAFQKELKGDNK